MHFVLDVLSYISKSEELDPNIDSQRRRSGTFAKLIGRESAAGSKAPWLVQM